MIILPFEMESQWDFDVRRGLTKYHKNENQKAKSSSDWQIDLTGRGKKGWERSIINFF